MNERTHLEHNFTDWLVHILGLLLLPGSLVLGRLYAPHVSGGPALCPWHALLDLQCLGCGLTRALCLFATGQCRASIHANWLIIPGVLAGLVIFSHSILWLIRACIGRTRC